MVLSPLRELRILVVSRNFEHGDLSTDKRFQIVTSLFESCEKLNEIHFSQYPLGYQTFRWIEGSLDVQSTLTLPQKLPRFWRI